MSRVKSPHDLVKVARLEPDISGFAGLKTLLAVCAAMACNPEAFAQEASQKRVITIVPRVSVTETITDNVRLSTDNRQAELVTEVSPGITITGNNGRLKGFLDYALSARLFAKDTSSTTTQNSLTAFGTLEAVDKRAFLDLNASITQQAISALGPQVTGGPLINANQTETTSLRISPYVRGRWANAVDYDARYSVSANRSQSSQVSDVTTKDLSFRLSGQGSSSRLGWSLNAGQQNVAFSEGRTTESDRLTGTVTYAVAPQLSLSLTGGQESSNFTSADKQSSWTSGFGVNWTPSPNTSVSVNRQNRPFGESHSFTLSHRTARTAWNLSDSMDVISSPAQSGVTSLGSTFDLYFSQFASIEPDPVKRTALVTAFLQTNGINPAGPVLSNFQASGLTLQRRQNLSFSLLGVRDTITVIATRSESSRLDSFSTFIDDFSNTAVIRQNGLSVSYAHRLTPDSSMNVLASTQHSSDAAGLQDSTSKTVNISLSTKVGVKTSVVVSARRVVFDSNTTPYSETAFTGTLNVPF